MAGAPSWRVQAFTELSVAQLYEILRLRQQVFVLEQACLYPDLDGADQQALHLCGRSPDGELVAYARLFAPDEPHAACTIGRILTVASTRGTGLGGQLLARALDEAHRRFPGAPVDISAQAHLTDFYARFGFVATSGPYDEDGIMHVDMRLT